ncbi:MAG: hypothetical protein ACOC7U_07590 [Spirochaetota bacterium]
MEVLVISEDVRIRSIFKNTESQTGIPTRYFPCNQLKRAVKEIEKDCFIYIDVSGYSETERKIILNHLSDTRLYSYGIIDPEEQIKDIGGCFLQGACDYIGGEIFHTTLSKERFNKVLDLRRKLQLGSCALENGSTAVESDPSPNSSRAAVHSLSSSSPCSIQSGTNWADIVPGREYTFCMMYIRADNPAALKEKLSYSSIQSVDSSFQKFLHQAVSPLNGKIWMWNNLEGLILFPHNGKSCDVIVLCFRLILDRNLISIEELELHVPLSYHIILHIGSTVYEKRGNTGTIISDSLNSIFHLGHKFARAGGLYLTQEIFNLIPGCLKQYFIPAGEFEGRKIKRMKPFI